MSIGSTNRFARALRRNATDAEAKLWQSLRGRRLNGLKFRRQATAGSYVVDFLCAEKRLVVELDGGQHSPEKDAARTAQLQPRGTVSFGSGTTTRWGIPMSCSKRS